MIVYQYSGADGIGSLSPPCFKVGLALQRLGIEHRLVNCKPANVGRVSRTGRLPVLELDDGTRIADSVTILDALEERFPNADLFPDDAVERSRDRVWEHYGTDVIYWFGFYFRWHHPEMAPANFKALFGRMPGLTRLLIRATLLRTARRRGRLHGIGKLDPATVERGTARAFATVAAGLGAGPFLEGRQSPGRGDLACAAVLAQIGFRQAMPTIEARFREQTALPAYLVRVFEGCGAVTPDWLR